MRYFLFISFFFILITQACSLQNPKPPKPVARDGEINLKSWDFTKDGPVELSGEWKFFWEKFIVSDAKKNSNLTIPEYKIKTPSSWNKYKISNDSELPPFGYASYKLKIILPQDQKRYMLYFRDAGSAYRIYQFIKSKKKYILIGYGGKAGKNKIDSKPLLSPTIAKISNTGEIVLVFEIANFYTDKGGMWNVPVIGLHKDIIQSRENDKLAAFFLIGCLIIIGLYNLFLFLLRPEEKGPLWFGIYCLLMVLRTFLTGRFIEERNKDLYIHSIIFKIEFLTMYAGAPIFFSYIYNAFLELFNKLYIYFNTCVFGLLSLFVIIFPGRIFTFSLQYFQIALLLSSLWTLSVLIKGSIKHKDRNALISLSGSIVFFITLVNDIFLTLQFYYGNFLLQYGFFIFILAQAIVIARQNAMARKSVERLSEELLIKSKEIKNINAKLSDLNQNLELKVDERTKKLTIANHEISKINENLKNARDALWGEMQVARKIQTVLLEEDPKVNNFEIVAYMKPSANIGGDYYDIINCEGVDWFVIGDVSGHGISAGLVMMMVQTAIHVVLKLHPETSPSNLLSIINRTISENVKKMGEDKYMTITVFAAHQDGELIFSGLHQDIIIFRSKTKTVELLPSAGIWLGLPDLFQDKNSDESFSLNIGDAMMMYTDGITEAWHKNSQKNNRDPETEMFGKEKLKKIFCENGHRPLDEIKNIILKNLEEYDCFDDVTMMIARRTNF